MDTNSKIFEVLQIFINFRKVCIDADNVIKIHGVFSTNSLCFILTVQFQSCVSFFFLQKISFFFYTHKKKHFYFKNLWELIKSDDHLLCILAKVTHTEFLENSWRNVKLERSRFLVVQKFFSRKLLQKVMECWF